MKATKIFFAAIAILSLAIIVTRCVPDNQDSPSPTNTFDVNIS